MIGLVQVSLVLIPRPGVVFLEVSGGPQASRGGVCSMPFA